MLAQYQTLDQDYLSGTTFDQLTAVQTALAAFQASVTAELDANQCGHDVGSGKVITLNLTLQEGVFYDNGCVVKATPITTGRPGLRTPTGDFRVFYKTSPFTMVSPWPLGSPDWYPTTVVQWVLEFADGYFLHDAYWENQNAFGPGSGERSGPGLRQPRLCPHPHRADALALRLDTAGDPGDHHQLRRRAWRARPPSRSTSTLASSSSRQRASATQRRPAVSTRRLASRRARSSGPLSRRML